MAPSRHLTVQSTIMTLVLLAAGAMSVSGCGASNSQTVDGIYVGSATTAEQRRAIKIAHAYLADRNSTDKNDRYSATPFDNGWVVRVERMTELTAGGQREVDPSSIRMLTIDANWQVIDYMPGGYAPGVAQ